MNKLTTLCYIEKDNKYLMLHRIKKENDINHDKWIGVGGKFELGESPEECLLREVKEETGYTLTAWKYRGIITFVYGEDIVEYMSLFTADEFEGTPIDCNEGVGMGRKRADFGAEPVGRRPDLFPFAGREGRFLLVKARI